MLGTGLIISPLLRQDPSEFPTQCPGTDEVSSLAGRKDHILFPAPHTLGKIILVFSDVFALGVR